MTEEYETYEVEFDDGSVETVVIESRFPVGLRVETRWRAEVDDVYTEEDEDGERHQYSTYDAVPVSHLLAFSDEGDRYDLTEMVGDDRLEVVGTNRDDGLVDLETFFELAELSEVRLVSNDKEDE